ncbi:tripartite ATP-independent transporter solute receptor, DctP family [Georgenia satyanarayanai]|uniref:Tripartite ATP-independent transporter solute receptor, DctP family n=1 Tax=Georgenia satyanarayanai TaxID=860221 RepID=A0A2Y9ALI7_9MICO|nr:TRAP transporter substrate-binding protein [Georgenia satyanarayanai]PYF99211.1 tripartite ATP-independent transporter DctP family solute receptor [Georgenia satyanarayanai]SSA43329.1 tripartite ATP-independent transporter solute receptor, DctP family [Georgenia satyanarayanai]
MSRRLTTAAAAGLVLTALAACSPSLEPGTNEGDVLHLALNQTESHPSYIALTAWGDHLEEQTDGRWSIDVYANETLGAQAEAMQLVSDGSVEMAIVSGPQLENLNRDFIALNLPTTFDDIDHQMRVVHDPAIVGDLYTSLEETNNVTVLGGFTQGSRSVYTTYGPVETPADLAGQKLRVQESELNVAMAQALGASATPMAYGELYTGLQSGVVDAAENNEVSYASQRHFEVAPHWSSTNHLVGLDYMIINTDMLASMTEEDRAVFDEGWELARAEHVELWLQATQDAVATAEAGGATFHDVDDEVFFEALEPLADRFLTTDEQWAIYDAARAASAESAD